MNEDKRMFHSIAAIASLAIGNALKACMFSILEHIGDVFSKRRHLKDRLQMIVKGTQQVFGDQFHCEIFLYDPTNQLLNLHASTSVDESVWDQYRSSASSGLNGWVIRNREVVGVGDVLEDSRAIREHARTNDIRSVAIAPIENNGRILGVIDLISSQKKEFSHEELWVLKMFAQHAGIAIADAIAYTQMQEMAMMDPVTDCFTRRYLETKGRDVLNRAHRDSRVLSILMVDIDHFKQINDTHGHLTGDRVLHKVASILQDHIRTSDICALYGGEEFVVVLPNIDEHGAIMIAERIRQSVLEETSPKVTISIGVSVLGKPDVPLEELIQAADDALYNGKNNGRNQVNVRNARVDI